MANIHENTKTGNHGTMRALQGALLVYLTSDNQLIYLDREYKPRAPNMSSTENRNANYRIKTVISE